MSGKPTHDARTRQMPALTEVLAEGALLISPRHSVSGSAQTGTSTLSALDRGRHRRPAEQSAAAP